MRKKSNKGKYEEFHRNTLIQTHIISKNNFTYRIILNIISKYLDPPKKILDIGCGAGTISLYLASKGNKVYGIDISGNAIKSCRESAKKLGIENYVHFEVMKFPNKIPNKKFDFILLIEVIEHLKKDGLALDKVYTLLKKGGVAIVSTPSKNAPMYKLGLANKFDQRVGHLRRYTLDELVDKCKSVGLQVLEVKKTEGIVRNFLFLNSVAGKFIRFIKFFIADLVTFIDDISLKIFGESDIFVVVKKP